MCRKVGYLLWIVPLVIAGVTLGAPLDTDVTVEQINDAEQLGGHFEGDIVLDSNQKEILESKRTALVGSSYLWPNYIVYYSIVTADFTTAQITQIKTAMSAIMLVSCIKFVERTTQTAYVSVQGQYTGCWSNLGHTGGQQFVNLQPNGCMVLGTIIHEFLHALGFVHMQSASDRDFYVKINWAAIQSGKSHNFDRYDSTFINDYGIPYDYNSVMHYRADSFTATGEDTIIPYESGVTIGQRAGLSFKDIKRINYLYPNCY
ncbi:high choriolytic enzyme 1-like [Armigeres subalbatus]|uniref:high choriolytic enzyme 1-like n=1 Tax=Armigeres subalbatus TaxID=124917 RepID=UPI002ED5AD0D